MSTTSERICPWGVGFSYRTCVHKEVMQCAGMFDFLEVPSDDYADPVKRERNDAGEALLKEACARFPTVGHGTHMSIGTADAPESTYLEQIAEFAARNPISEYSEHMSFTRSGDEHIAGFICIPYTDLGVAATVKNAKLAKARVGLPFMLENVTYHFAIPGATMAEHDFLGRVSEQADTGLLIDITNVFINATNNGYDPVEFIRKLPGDRVLHAHFCGVTEEHNYLWDTHCEPTTKEIWSLLDETLACTDLRSVILERDEKFDPFSQILEEVWKAREVWSKHRPIKAPPEIRPSKYEPQPDYVDDSPHSAELALFQKVLLDVLLTEELSQALDKEGESALKHTGIGADERKVIAGIPSKRREILGRSARWLRDEKETKAREAQRVLD